jgi:predicted regulator of Ras-like GTPase activity (Roadblock/LC7/MglB family)
VTIPIAEALSALLDLRGVEGTFFATREGKVVARALPRYFDDDALARVAPRLGRVFEALDELDGSVEGTLSRHPNHAVLLRPAGEGLLCIIATKDISVPSLKRAAELVARKVAALASTATYEDPTRAAVIPEAPHVEPSTPPPTPSRSSVPGAQGLPAVRWRGSKV